MAITLRQSICILAYYSTVQDNKPMTVDPWTHVKSTTMVAMGTAIKTTHNTYIVCFFTRVVYMSTLCTNLHTICMVGTVTL